MKNLILLFLLILGVITGYSQTAATIYTPNGSLVGDSYYFPEASGSQITSWNNDATTAYPSATRMTNASATYNCHSYTFNKTEGGGNVWIGYYSLSTEDVYWNDCSYTAIGTQTYPGKVSYGSADNHSAVTTGTTDVFESKWGNWPTMRHNKSLCPYSASTLSYYVKPTISGPTNFCTSDSYTVVNIPSGSSVINWTVSGSASLSASSGNPITITDYADEDITITATFTTSCGNVTISKTVTSGQPAPSGIYIQGTTSASTGYFYNYYLNSEYPNATSYSWDFYNGSSNASIYGSGSTIGVVFNDPGSYTGNVTAYTNCGSLTLYSAAINVDVYSLRGGSEEKFVYFPNPANNILKVNLKNLASELNNTNASFIPAFESTNFQATLYNDKGALLSTGKNISGEVMLDTSNIPDGTYFLHILEGKNLTRKQVIIKH